MTAELSECDVIEAFNGTKRLASRDIYIYAMKYCCEVKLDRTTPVSIIGVMVFCISSCLVMKINRERCMLFWWQELQTSFLPVMMSYSNSGATQVFAN